ncbi:MAG: DUF1559 domain-containing protein, partial [Planctomycetota bacterium]
VHNYEMLHQVYPPGTVNATGPIQSLPQGYHHNWLIQLLPYMEQKNTHAHIDSLVGVYHPNNMPVRRLDIGTFNCPSAPHARRAYSDYAGVHNDIEAPIDVTNNGVFFLNSRIGYFDLKDGSSHTLFIGEKETYAGDLGWMSGTRATLRNTGFRINAAHVRNFGASRPHWPRPTGFPPGVEDKYRTEALPGDEELLDTLFGEEMKRQNSISAWNAIDQFARVYDNEDTGGAGMYGGMGVMPAGGEYVDSGAEQEAAKKLAIKTFRENPALAVGGFGSPHPGGSQFAVGDGSVRFCSETIDPIVFLQLGHRADGRLIAEDW